jgi:hypothetical protein
MSLDECPSRRGEQKPSFSVRISMTNGFQKLEKKILILAATCFVVFSYFLYDDSLLDFDSNTGDLQKIGVISLKSNDVRQKYSKQYIWRKSSKNSAVHQGDSVFTGENSESQIELLDGSKMTIHENSLVVFNFADGQLGLDFNFGGMTGGITGDTKLRVKDCGQVYELSGGGSQFQLDKEGGCKGVKVKVLTGQVSVNGSSLKKSETAIVKKGFAPRILPPEPAKPKVITTLAAAPIPLDVPGTLLPALDSAQPADETVQTVDTQPKAEATPAPLVAEKKQMMAPVIIEPVDKYEHLLSYDESGKLTSPSFVILKWTVTETVNPKPYFEMEIATDPQFASVISRRYSPQVSARSPDLKKGEYFFRVREYISKDQPSSEFLWSKAIAFSVQEKRSDETLPAPKLLTKNINYRAPASAPPIFKWTSVPKAEKYVVEVSPANDFKKTARFTVNELSHPWNQFLEGKYFFRVSAVSKSGGRSEPSEIGSIDVKLTAPVLTPVEPHTVLLKDAEDPGGPEKFKVKWTGLSIADSYQIELSEGDDFKNALVFKSREPANVIVAPKPGSYKWRVRPLASTGKPLTDYSQSGDLQYNIKVPLVTPTLLEPGENLTLYFQQDTSTPFWMEWKVVRQATFYDIQVSTKKDFSVVDITKRTTDHRFLFNHKLPQGNLYWRVRAQGENGKLSDWTTARRVRVLAGKESAESENENGD